MTSTASDPLVVPISEHSPLLSTEKLTAGYRQERVIFDIDVAFPAGVITALIGSNGAGKSTLLKSLFGLTHIFAGTVLIEGRPVEPVARNFVMRGIGYVPQVANVFPSLTVRENLDIGSYVRGTGSIDSVLNVFPALGKLLRRPAFKLSGGERNMLAVGRALMSDPKLLLLDEATGGLAPALATEFWEYIAGLARTGIAVVAVEQNVDLALEYATNVYVFGSGRVVAQGPAKEVAARKDLEQLFLVNPADE